jgi:Complex I intermediate-associated protein 30 (CIA30)
MIMVLRSLISAALTAVMLGGAVLPAIADGAVTGQTIIEDFTMQPETRWRFFTDQVMGGMSTGGVAFAQENGTSFARMTGRVSTANRGGFIQMRLDLTSPPPEGTTGVRLIVRGNGQRYFLHLRTGGTFLPWQYYQAGFDVTESWSEVRLPLGAFKASGALLRGVPNPASMTSVAVVAYGRDHDAQIDVREVGFY